MNVRCRKNPNNVGALAKEPNVAGEAQLGRSTLERCHVVRNICPAASSSQLGGSRSRILLNAAAVHMTFVGVEIRNDAHDQSCFVDSS